MTPAVGGGPGVYVHVPFCTTRCHYCAFATWTDREHLVADYLDACVVDVRRRWDGGNLGAAATVYFGGGTPSLVDPRGLARVLDAIPRVEDAEVTVEANPDALDDERLAVYREHGVTRISLGVQSTSPPVLAALGRTHDPANVARAVDSVRAVGMPTFNVDLIAGTPGESGADFERTLHDVLALEPPHVSVYGLTLEPGTVLTRRVSAGECGAPDPDVQADRYLRADAVLAGAGLAWYEVSNWARPGHECRHNLGYWTGADCVAIGAAAHGHTAGRRWWNVTTPERYLARVRAGDSPVAGAEHPPAGTVAEERFGLALRTRAGAPRPAGLDPDVLAEVVDAGLVVVEADRVVLTTTGRLLATEVTLRLLAGTRYDGVPTRVP